MTASAPWARQFFACQKLGVHRATPTAVAGLAVTDAGIEFRIQCPTLGSSEPSAFKAIGDPDLYIRGDQVRVQIAWSPAPGDKLFVQAAPDGRRCAEFGDRRIIGDSQWSLTVEPNVEPGGGWRATVLLPWALLPAGTQNRWRGLAAALVWCSDAGMTAWPTPFVTWHGWRLYEGSVPLGSPTLGPDELSKRSIDHLRTLPQRLGSFPDDAPDFMSRFAAMLRDPDQGDLADVVHRRASSGPLRTFLRPDGDPEQSLSFDLSMNLALLDQFDATAQATRLGRGEMLVNLAAIYQRDGDEALFNRVQHSARRWLENHPITRGLQPRVPAGPAGSPDEFPDVWSAHIVGGHTMGQVTRALFTLSMRRPVDSRLLALAFKRGVEAFNFGVDSVPGHYHWNHSVNWINKMIEVAALSLEMADAMSRIDASWRCMDRALETMILPDGLSQELCSIYDFVVFYRLVEAMDACRDSQVSIPEGARAWANRLLEAYSLSYLLPNGQDAGFSDSNPASPDGFCPPAPANEAYLRRVCAALDRPDLLYMGTGGRFGTKPGVVDHAARFAGVYAARTGWTKDDSALILDAGPLGRAHAHDDRLNLVYSHKNRILLIDHTYPSGLSADGFNSRSAQAHSTVTVDGFQSDYLPDFFKRVNRREQAFRFEEKGGLHYLEATHRLEAIVGPRRITVHRRIVADLSRFIWIIDRIEGEGGCVSRTRFVLPAGTIQVDEDRFRTCSGTVDLGGMSLDGLCAQLRGAVWPPEAAGRHIVEFTAKEHGLPSTRSCLLIPFEAGACPWPRVESCSTADPARLRLHWPDGRVENVEW